MRGVLFAAGMLGALPAHAEPDDEERAEAARLFQEGRELDESGEIAKACEKFEKSYALDPAPGTAMNLAVCAEEKKQWRRAWELYDTAANVFLSRSDKRARFARDRADEVLREHPDDVEAKPEPPRREKPPTITRTESRTGLKVVTALSLGVGLISGVWFYHSYRTAQDWTLPPDAVVPPGTVTVGSEDCGRLTIDESFAEACAASERSRWLFPTMMIAGGIGTVTLVYLLASKPKTVTVTPAVTAQSAGVSATIRW